MNTKIIEQNDETIVLELELNEIEWDAEIQKAYEKEKSHYKVEGFRPGKAPRKIIETQYGEGVFFEDAFNHWISQSYIDYLKENPDIKPLFDHPHFEIETLEKTGVKVKMTIELRPKFELGQYKGLEVEKVAYSVSDEEVDAELQRLAKDFAETVDKGGDTVVENGDIAVIDFAGSIDGEPFEGGSDEDYPLEIGSHSFIDNFEEQLIGLKIDDTKDVKVKFPDDYGAENLAGKEAVFYCTIKNIQTKKLPELNDEFAVKVGKFENFNALKGFIRSQLEQRAMARANQETENKLMDMIVDGTEIKLPDSMVEHQLDSVMHDLEYRLMYQGLTLEQYAKYLNKSVEELREDKREDAKKVAKMNLIMQEIINRENITVVDAEIDARLYEMASQARKTFPEFKKSLSTEQLDYIINDIVVGKVYDFLNKENNIK